LRVVDRWDLNQFSFLHLGDLFDSDCWLTLLFYESFVPITPAIHYNWRNILFILDTSHQQGRTHPMQSRLHHDSNMATLHMTSWWLTHDIGKNSPAELQLHHDSNMGTSIAVSWWLMCDIMAALKSKHVWKKPQPSLLKHESGNQSKHVSNKSFNRLKMDQRGVGMGSLHTT
jgi:hypothetical protein